MRTLTPDKEPTATRAHAQAVVKPTGRTGRSFHRLPHPLFPPELLDRLQDQAPDHRAIRAPELEQLIRLMGRSNAGVIPMRIDQQLGGAIDVGIRATQATAA